MFFYLHPCALSAYKQRLSWTGGRGEAEPWNKQTQKAWWWNHLLGQQWVVLAFLKTYWIWYFVIWSFEAGPTCVLLFLRIANRPHLSSLCLWVLMAFVVGAAMWLRFGKAPRAQSSWSCKVRRARLASNACGFEKVSGLIQADITSNPSNKNGASG